MELSKYTYALVALKFGEKTRARTWGLFRTSEDALECLLTGGDIHFECGYYDHAVIERIPFGSHSIAKPLFWYKATYSEGVQDPVITRVEPPPESLQTFNFWGSLSRPWTTKYPL